MINKYDTPMHKSAGKKPKPHKDGVVSTDELVDVFGVMASSLYVLGVKLKGFHWNVVGDQFFPMHKILDKQVDTLLGFADEAAEIIRQLDIDAPAPVGMMTMVKRSFIKETLVADLVAAEVFIPIIVADYVTMIQHCHKLTKLADEAGRQDLSDFAITVLQYVDKYKWQFESGINKE